MKKLWIIIPLLFILNIFPFIPTADNNVTVKELAVHSTVISKIVTV